MSTQSNSGRNSNLGMQNNKVYGPRASIKLRTARANKRSEKQTARKEYCDEAVIQEGYDRDSWRLAAHEMHQKKAAICHQKADEHEARAGRRSVWRDRAESHEDKAASIRYNHPHLFDAKNGVKEGYEGPSYSGASTKSGEEAIFSQEGCTVTHRGAKHKVGRAKHDHFSDHYYHAVYHPDGKRELGLVSRERANLVDKGKQRGWVAHVPDARSNTYTKISTHLHHGDAIKAVLDRAKSRKNYTTESALGGDMVPAPYKRPVPSHTKQWQNLMYKTSDGYHICGKCSNDQMKHGHMAGSLHVRMKNKVDGRQCDYCNKPMLKEDVPSAENTPYEDAMHLVALHGNGVKKAHIEKRYASAHPQHREEVLKAARRILGQPIEEARAISFHHSIKTVDTDRIARDLLRKHGAEGVTKAHIDAAVAHPVHRFDVTNELERLTGKKLHQWTW